MQELIKLAYAKNYKCFFFGAKEEVVQKVVDFYSQKYGPEIIAGYKCGYYSKEEEHSIAEKIANSGTQILFVAITSPKKENFLHDYKDTIKNVNFSMGVGGSFDVIAGVTQRAPLWIQKSGLEWFYRLLQEPGRMWKRYTIGNVQFIWLVVKEIFRKKHRN